MVLECGLGIVYGVGVGYDPLLVYSAAIFLNYISIILVVIVIERLLIWKPNLKNWIERKLSRGRRIIDRYGYLGILFGVFVLSPIQLAIIGRLLCLKPSRLYPALLGATIIVATAYLGVALGIFKILLQ